MTAFLLGVCLVAACAMADLFLAPRRHRRGCDYCQEWATQGRPRIGHCAARELLVPPLGRTP